MNPVKFKDIERNPSAVARRVLDATPRGDMANAAQIHAALSDRGSRIERRVFDACITDLVDRGLVVQRGDKYQQVKVRVKESRSAEEINVQDSRVTPLKTAPESRAANQSSVPADPISQLGALAASLRRCADRAEELAIEIQGKIDGTAEDLQHLRMLQSVLSQIGAKGKE